MENLENPSKIQPKTTIAIFIAVATLLVSSTFVYNFRVIKSVDGIHFIEKSEPGFRINYVDISNWTLRDLFEKRRITIELIQAGKASSIPHIAEFNHALERGVRSIKDFDERYGISDGFEWTIDKMHEIDKEYEISERIEQTIDDASNAVKELWEKLNEG